MSRRLWDGESACQSGGPSGDPPARWSRCSGARGRHSRVFLTSTPRASGTNPSGHRVEASACAPSNSAASKPRQSRFAPLRFAPLKLAWPTLAPRRSAFVKSARSKTPVDSTASQSRQLTNRALLPTAAKRIDRDMSQSERSARSSHAERSSASISLAPRRLWPSRRARWRFSPERSAPTSESASTTTSSPVWHLILIIAFYHSVEILIWSQGTAGPRPPAHGWNG